MTSNDFAALGPSPAVRPPELYIIEFAPTWRWPRGLRSPPSARSRGAILANQLRLITRPPRSTSSERNEVWAVSGNTSGWFGAERVAGPPLKDSSNTQQNSLGAPAHTDNSAKRTPKTHFFLFFQNSDMLFLLRYEPKGLDKTKGRKYNFPLPPGGPDSQKQSLPTKKTRIFMNIVPSPTDFRNSCIWRVEREPYRTGRGG